MFDAELEHRSGCGGSVDVAELVDAALEVRSTMAISAEASRLLQGYYIMSRRYRGAAASINSRYAVPFLEYTPTSVLRTPTLYPVVNPARVTGAHHSLRIRFGCGTDLLKRCVQSRRLSLH